MLRAAQWSVTEYSITFNWWVLGQSVSVIRNNTTHCFPSVQSNHNVTQVHYFILTRLVDERNVDISMVILSKDKAEITKNSKIVRYEPPWAYVLRCWHAGILIMNGDKGREPAVFGIRASTCETLRGCHWSDQWAVAVTWVEQIGVLGIFHRGTRKIHMGRDWDIIDKITTHHLITRN